MGAEHPNVVSVFENKGHELQTTRSWEFLGLENNYGVVPKDSIWEKGRYGEGTIIANIDSGQFVIYPITFKNQFSIMTLFTNNDIHTPFFINYFYNTLFKQ